MYYFVFRFSIRLFHLKTPGREEEDSEQASQSTNPLKNQGIREKAEAILPLIGGAANIIKVDACITRLRLTLVDEAHVNEVELKKLGAAGIMRLGKGNVQIVFGTDSELIKEELIPKLN